MNSRDKSPRAVLTSKHNTIPSVKSRVEQKAPRKCFRIIVSDQPVTETDDCNKTVQHETEQSNPTKGAKHQFVVNMLKSPKDQKCKS